MLSSLGQRFCRGSIGFIIVMFLALLGFMMAGSQFLRTAQRNSQASLNQTTRAGNMAKAGIAEAISWFQKQAVQPVRSSADTVAYPYPDAAFYPRTSTSTVSNDTIDESIGLVREYVIDADTSLWGRFEVRRQANTATNPVDPHAVHDITARRIDNAVAGDGLVWYIESEGFVYKRANALVAFTQAPNKILGRFRVATEIGRLQLQLPANAAVIVSSRTVVTANGNGKIIGGNNIGLAYYLGASGPTVDPSGEVSGTPATSKINTGSFSIQTFFGMPFSQVRYMTDVTATDVSSLPTTFSSMQLVLVNGDANFTHAHPLRGGGVLIVNGNLSFASDSVSNFSGFIYVAGNATLNGSVTVSGAMAVNGSLSLTGIVPAYQAEGQGEVSQAVYDANVINIVRQQVMRYRSCRPILDMPSSNGI